MNSIVPKLRFIIDRIKTNFDFVLLIPKASIYRYVLKLIRLAHMQINSK